MFGYNQNGSIGITKRNRNQSQSKSKKVRLGTTEYARQVVFGVADAIAITFATAVAVAAGNAVANELLEVDVKLT